MPLVLEWNDFRCSISSCSSTASFASLKTICRNGSFKPFEVCHCTLLDILPVFMSITTVPVPRIISNTLSTASYAALKVIGSIAPSNPLYSLTPNPVRNSFFNTFSVRACNFISPYINPSVNWSITDAFIRLDARNYL